MPHCCVVIPFSHGPSNTFLTGCVHQGYHPFLAISIASFGPSFRRVCLRLKRNWIKTGHCSLIQSTDHDGSAIQRWYEIDDDRFVSCFIFDSYCLCFFYAYLLLAKVSRCSFSGNLLLFSLAYVLYGGGYNTINPYWYWYLSFMSFSILLFLLLTNKLWTHLDFTFAPWW